MYVCIFSYDGILVETLESGKSLADIDGIAALCLGEDPAFLEVTQTLEQLGERCITSEEPQVAVFADEATLADDKSFADNLEPTRNWADMTELEQLGERCITSEEPQVGVFADEATLEDDKSFADTLECVERVNSFGTKRSAKRPGKRERKQQAEERCTTSEDLQNAKVNGPIDRYGYDIGKPSIDQTKEMLAEHAKLIVALSRLSDNGSMDDTIEIIKHRIMKLKAHLNSLK